jgi:hypothetical protein
MTIRRGDAWGVVGPVPRGLVIVASDAELRRVVCAARDARATVPPCGLVGGDLMRTIGGTGDASRFDAGEVVAMSVDVVRVTTDEGRVSWFVAHLVARRSWWRGRVVAAMNAELLGRWDVAPRSHPNDGRVDVLELSARLGPRQRWAVRRRLPSGAHLPHPDIAVRAGPSVVVDLERPVPLQLDGVAWGRARRVELTVEPDALTVCV